MNKGKKRAFTITELVIVIAVVAILAAVLIPTFSNVIKKANMSVDQQAVRNMNIALINANIDGSVEVLSDALEVLEEAGMDAKDYKALASGYDFVWVKSINRVLYVEKATNKVVYPEEYVHMTYLPTNETWMTLEGAIKGDDSWETTEITAQDLTKAEVKFGVVKTGDEIEAVKVDTAPRLVSVVEYLNDNKNKNKDVDLYLGADINLHGAEWQPIRTLNGNFDGNNFKITNLQMSNPTTASDTTVEGGSGNVYTFYGFIGIFKGTSFKNVTIDVDIQTPGVSGGFVGNDDNYKPFGNHTVAGAIGGILKETADEVVVENVTVDGTIVGHSRVSGVIGYIGGRPKSDKKATGKVTLRNLTNNAIVTSENYNKSDFSTAGGIVSIVIQTQTLFGLEFDDCTNTGAVTGMHGAGMIAYVSTNGSIYMHNCTNSGTITSRFDGVENLATTYSTMRPSASGFIGILQSKTANFISENTFGDKVVNGILIENCTHTGTVQVYAGGDRTKAILEECCTLDNELAKDRPDNTYTVTSTQE